MVKLMLEAKAITHDAGRVQNVGTRGQHDHVGDLIALLMVADLQVHKGDANRKGRDDAICGRDAKTRAVVSHTPEVVNRRDNPERGHSVNHGRATISRRRSSAAHKARY